MKPKQCPVCEGKSPDCQFCHGTNKVYEVKIFCPKCLCELIIVDSSPDKITKDDILCPVCGNEFSLV